MSTDTAPAEPLAEPGPADWWEEDAATAARSASPNGHN